ncbi:hypothetical protein OH77DRAFT_254540 [Trametes cingulata]|nr:hypothetical protein OH77DRAFT_254540 [Trametes cingulata]
MTVWQKPPTIMQELGGMGDMLSVRYSRLANIYWAAAASMCGPAMERVIICGCNKTHVRIQADDCELSPTAALGDLPLLIAPRTGKSKRSECLSRDMRAALMHGSGNTTEGLLLLAKCSAVVEFLSQQPAAVAVFTSRHGALPERSHTPGIRTFAPPAECSIRSCMAAPTHVSICTDGRGATGRAATATLTIKWAARQDGVILPTPTSRSLQYSTALLTVVALS